MADSSSPRGGLHIGLWVVQALLAFAFVAAGAMKLLTPPDELLAQGMTWVSRFPSGFSRFVGLVELLGGIGLVAPAATRIAPVLTPAAAGGLVLTMAVAALDHLRAGELMMAPPSVVLGSLSLFVLWGRGWAARIPARGA
jgi:uncharacterized membrane protein YphA (DoxX/SURF4 family)